MADSKNTFKDKLLSPDQVQLDEQKRTKAIDMLYEAMLFWHSEGTRIIKALNHKLNMDGEGREAARLAAIWKNVDDRWIDIAAKLAPYQSPKLSSVETKTEVTVKHVVRPYTRAKDHAEFLARVTEDEKFLPKPQVVTNLYNDHTIDDIEYENVNQENDDNSRKGVH